MKKCSLLRLILIHLALFIAGSAFAAADIQKSNFTGSLPRSLADGNFSITFKVTSLDYATISTLSSEELMKRITIKLPDVNTNIAVAKDAASATTEVPFYLEGSATTSQEADKGVISYSVTVYESSVGKLDEKVEKSLKLNLTYNDGTGNTAELKDITIEQNTAVPKDKPKINQVVSTNRYLGVSWDQIGTVGYTTGTGTPSGVAVIFIDRGVSTNEAFPAKTFSASGDTPNNCYYIPGTASGEACIRCDNETAGSEVNYLNLTAISKINGVYISTANATQTSISSPELKNGTEYAVTMVYLPDGVNRASCVFGTPKPDITMSELNGEPDAKSESNLKCFIATAAYGSPFHDYLYRFRWFRNHVLLTNPVGQAFVRYYYRLSPPIAETIAQHEYLRAIVRGALWAPAQLIGLYQKWTGAGDVIPQKLSDSH